MAALIDLTGRRFGRLSVLDKGQSTERGEARWLCLCDCGAETLVRGHCLRRGDTRSCGCLKRETQKNRKCQKCGSFLSRSKYEGEHGRVCDGCRTGSQSPNKKRRSKAESGVDVSAVNLARMKW